MKKRKFSSDFKAKVVLEALSERYTIQEIARKHEIHLFDKPNSTSKDGQQDMEKRYLQTIGKQKMEIDFLKKALS
jgi:transposase